MQTVEGWRLTNFRNNNQVTAKLIKTIIFFTKENDAGCVCSIYVLDYCKDNYQTVQLAGSKGKVFPFLTVTIRRLISMQDQLFRANLCIFFSPKGPFGPDDVITATARGPIQPGRSHSLDHGNYCISISLGPQQGYTYS